MNATRLLLLEDDAVSLAFLRDALDPLGCAIATAGDCAQAAALARGDDALWIFDACLPDGSGASLLHALRARGLAAPAIALTADPAAQGPALREAGFAQVLPKPIGAARLRAAALAAAAAGAEPVRWDDARALPALAGRHDALAALRQLFLEELRGQLRRVHEAVDRADHDAARAELHRLQAGCGFVGATRLHAAVRELYARPDDAPALRRLLRIGERQLSED
jgi:CheY-like chemotaxis protein